MTRFEHTHYFRLLEPFIQPLLRRMLFRDERYVLFFCQIFLSGLLYLVSTALQTLLVDGINQVELTAPAAEVLRSFVHLGTILTIFWCTWYALTIMFRMIRVSWPLNPANAVGLSPRLLSCILTGGLTLSLALRQGETLEHSWWLHTLLGLTWAYACLRPTVFGATES